MNDEHMTMVEDCETRESRLSDWERRFIDDMKRRLLSNRALTPDQITKLEEVWESATKNG